jgi:hypothetical protein
MLKQGTEVTETLLANVTAGECHSRLKPTDSDEAKTG